MSTRVIKSLTGTSIYQENAVGVSLIKLTNRTTNFDIKSMISSVNLKNVGENFMAIVSYGLVSTVMEYAAERKLLNIKSQWMYIISDTHQRQHDMTQFDRLLEIGHNVAFVHNTTKTDKRCVVSITRNMMMNMIKMIFKLTILITVFNITIV